MLLAFSAYSDLVAKKSWSINQYIVVHGSAINFVSRFPNHSIFMLNFCLILTHSWREKIGKNSATFFGHKNFAGKHEYWCPKDLASFKNTITCHLISVFTENHVKHWNYSNLNSKLFKILLAGNPATRREWVKLIVTTTLCEPWLNLDPLQLQA